MDVRLDYVSFARSFMDPCLQKMVGFLDLWEDFMLTTLKASACSTSLFFFLEVFSTLLRGRLQVIVTSVNDLSFHSEPCIYQVVCFC
jgi:hypothetical protein